MGPSSSGALGVHCCGRRLVKLRWMGSWVDVVVMYGARVELGESKEVGEGGLGVGVEGEAGSEVRGEVVGE